MVLQRNRTCQHTAYRTALPTRILQVFPRIRLRMKNACLVTLATPWLFFLGYHFVPKKSFPASSFLEVKVMSPSSAAHTTCLVLATLAELPAPQAFLESCSACAFCGGGVAPCRGTPFCRKGSSSSSSSRRTRWNTAALPGSSQACFPYLRTGQIENTRSNYGGLLLASGGRWREDDEEDDRTVGRSRRRNRSEPWEDIQWSNVSVKRDARATGGGRDGGRGRERVDDDDYIDEEKDEEIEEEYLGLEGPEGRSARFLREDDDFEGDSEDSYWDGAPPRRPAERETARLSERNGVEESPLWNRGWFDDAQEAKQSGLLRWARGFYNALFWYGAAAEDREQLPAMNFQDLLERFEAFSGSRPPETSRPIVPPEDLGAEQDYRWRPGRRDSVPVGASRRREEPNASYDGVSGRRRTARDRRRKPAREDRVRSSASRDDPQLRRREEVLRDGDGDRVMIRQLRRKQRQLADREHGLEMDLEKIQERLGVVDATVELWLRRSQAMSARGSTDTDTEMLQAKRRIYQLKDEGRQLDIAKLELEERLKDCRAKLDRIVQELEGLGEDAVPIVYFEPTGGEEMETEGNGAVEAPVPVGEAVRLDVELMTEERDLEAMPIVGET